MATRPKIQDMTPARRLFLIIAIAALALLVIADFFVEHHPYFGLDGTPGFAAWFGLGSAILSVVLALGWAGVAGEKRERADD